METTIIGYIGYILGFYWDTGKENGNYYKGVESLPGSGF